MQSTRRGSTKRAVAALAVAGAMVLAPLGGQGAEPAAEFKGLLKLGTGPVPLSADCPYQLNCVLFTETFGGVHPLNDPCFNNNATLPRQNVDLRKEIFGADPQGNPAEEDWGSKYPFLNIKDLSAYTTRGARTVKFTLDESEGLRTVGVSVLRVELLNTNCDRLSGFSLNIADQETLTKTIPKATKWFVLYGVDSIGSQQRIHRNERWHMLIP